MGLEALLAKLENHAAVTPGTPRYADGVPPRPAPGKACTPVTPGTPRNDNAGSNARAQPGRKQTTQTVVPVAPVVAHREHPTGTQEPPEAPMSPPSQKALTMLELNPGLHHAVVTDTTSDPDAAVVAVAVRGVGIGEILVPRGKYDGLAVLAMLEAQIIDGTPQPGRFPGKCNH